MAIYKTIIAEKNNCYKSNKDKKRKPVGILLHSTGANNPKLSRYVQPLNYVKDTTLGENIYRNDWVNNAKPGGVEICCHAFIGKLANGTIATVQILPWDIPDWNSGKGSKGRAWQEGYIEIEICEDGLTDKAYFNAVYAEAVSLVRNLCEVYGLPTTKVTDIKKGGIVDHKEMSALGYASNHADVGHWFSKFGKTMDDFRADVAGAKSPVTPVKPVTKPVPTPEPITQAFKVGDIVKLAKNATYYGGKDIPDWVVNQNWIIKEIQKDRAVIDKNQTGTNSINSPVSTKYLTVVQSATIPNKKSNEEIACEVIRGKWGNGTERRKLLEKAGYDYDEIQAIVNKLL
jgi:hypothetical protein